jgi:hypothetical protein
LLTKQVIALLLLHALLIILPLSVTGSVPLKLKLLPGMLSKWKHLSPVPELVIFPPATFKLLQVAASQYNSHDEHRTVKSGQALLSMLPPVLRATDTFTPETVPAASEKPVLVL